MAKYITRTYPQTTVEFHYYKFNETGDLTPAGMMQRVYHGSVSRSDALSRALSENPEYVYTIDSIAVARVTFQLDENDFLRLATVKETAIKSDNV